MTPALEAQSVGKHYRRTWLGSAELLELHDSGLLSCAPTALTVGDGVASGLVRRSNPKRR